MKKHVLYGDVVSGVSPAIKKSESTNGTKSSNSQEGSNTSKKDSGKERRKVGKDDQSQPSLEQRAEQLAEDPYLTEIEAKEADTKDKSKKAEEGEGGGDGQKDSKTPEQELNILASRSDKVLLSAKTIFPFDLFPDTLTIDANKVNIVQKIFFWSEVATSILLKEIMDVRVESALFFGKLVIDYGPHPLKISTVEVAKMWKSDALKAKEIIEGILVVYRSENINTTELKPEETLDEIKEVGKIEERET